MQCTWQKIGNLCKPKKIFNFNISLKLSCYVEKQRNSSGAKFNSKQVYAYLIIYSSQQVSCQFNFAKS